LRFQHLPNLNVRAERKASNWLSLKELSKGSNYSTKAPTYWQAGVFVLPEEEESWYKSFNECPVSV
jgi:hypothetical protein